VQEGFSRPLFRYQGNQFILAAHSHSCNCSSTWKNKKKEKTQIFQILEKNLPVDFSAGKHQMIVWAEWWMFIVGRTVLRGKLLRRCCFNCYFIAAVQCTLCQARHYSALRNVHYRKRRRRRRHYNNRGKLCVLECIFDKCV